MSKIKGICKNIDECSLAEEKVIQIVDKSEFICSECHKPLSVVEDAKNSNGVNKKLIAIIVAAIIIMIGVIVALSNSGGEDTTPKQEVDQSVATEEKANEQKSDASGNENVTTEQTKSSKDGSSAVSQSQGVSVPQQSKTDVSSPKPNSNNVQRGSSSDGGSINLGYAVYDGPSSGGRPNGIGTLTFRRNYTINLEDGQGGTVEASAGDKMFMAKFKNGRLVQGELHRSNGERISVIVGN